MGATAWRCGWRWPDTSSRSRAAGDSGFAAAKAFKPDLAFLDIGMPGMNGYELARAVGTSPESMVLRHSHPKKRTSGVPKCFPRTKTIDQGTLRRLIDAGANVHAQVFGGAS